MLGKLEPRIWTPPITDLAKRKNTLGYDAIDFAHRIGVKLNPWQKWLYIHALELNDDGTFRFKVVLVLVARQNGKTLAKLILTLWRMYERGAQLTVDTAQDLSQAREVHRDKIQMMLEDEWLSERFDPEGAIHVNEKGNPKPVGVWRKTRGDEFFRIDGEFGPRNLVKALTRKAGRGLSDCAELNIDELREQHNWLAWAAVSKIVMANPEGQIWLMSNAGTHESVVLNHLRKVALSGLDDPHTSTGIFEWSASDGCALDDRDAWAQANPSLGYTLPVSAVESALMTDPPNVFRTEVLCQFVDVLDTAVDLSAWESCADPTGTMDALRDRLALCVEVAGDGSHVTAVVAGVQPDGRVRCEVVGAWQNTVEARAGLPDVVDLVRPRVTGWFPSGPGVKLSPMLKKRKAHPIRGQDVSEAHMTLAEYVDGRRLLHPDDGLLNAHMQRTRKLGGEGVWQFARDVPNDAVHAAAGAVWLALTMPEPRQSRRRLIVPSDVESSSDELSA